jgi:TP901 family phage tail tape measure protein
LAGSQREFELLFKLKASLGGGFNSTFKNAIDTNKKLQDSLKSVNSLQSKIDGYTKQASAIDKNKEKLQALTQEHDKLQRELNETQEPSEALRKKLEKNENQIQQTTAKIEEQTRKLNSLGGELKEAGINTDNLESANTKLQKSYDKLKSSQENLKRINEEQTRVKENISSTKTQLVGTVGTYAAIAAAIYAGPVKAAMSFESNMAEVAKVVDWLKDDTGNVTKEYAELKNEIIGLTTKIPMTAEEISQIIAAAGQSNVATDNKGLMEFAEAAAKMGIAFDTTSEQAGEWMAKWRTSFKMSQTDVIALADKINYLGNTSAANAEEISNVVTKIGPLGEVAGLASGQIAALGASMIGVGVQQDVAATGIKNLMLAMVAGNSVTKRQAGVLDKLGINSKKLAERMQTDATGAILDFLGAVKKLPEAERAAALKDYFGSESIAAISPLLTNLDGLKEQFEKVGDASKYAGSMEAEYASRADTTENKVQLAKNSLQALSVTLGDTFLPIIGQAAEKLTKVITKVTEFAQANPKLVSTALKIVGALAALKVGLLTTRLGVLSIQKDFLFVQGIFAKFAGKTAIAEAASIGLGGKLTNAGKGILNYFGSVKGAMGGVSNAIGKIFTNSPILTKVSGFVGGINSKILTGLSGIAGKAAGVLTGAGSKMVGFLLKPFLSIGGRLSGILSNVGGIILKSPLGTIGRVLASGFSSFGTLLAPIGNLLKTTFAPLARLGTTLLGPLGGIAGKLFPIIGVVTLVITVFELVRKNLDKIRGAIENVFGKKGVEVFDKVVAVITNIGNAIKGVFSDGNIGAARDKINEIFGEKGVAVFDVFVKAFEKIKTAAGQFVNFVIAHIVPVAENVLTLITTSIIPGIVGFVKAAAPTIMSIIQSVANFIGAIIPVIGGFIAGLMPVISQIIAFIQTYVLPIIGQVFSFITGTVLPMIAEGIQSILPIVTNILSTLLPFIQTAVTTIWNIVQPIIQGILAAIQFAMPTIQAIIQNVIGTVTGIIHGLMTVLGGIITFITGVFTGNWSQAWEGIKSIFSGIWEGISSICKGVINGIITAVNVVIRGLNKLKVPDWVPGLGGKGINIAEIPMLAKGTRRTPETFIAGEEGPEIITNSPGRTVFTANQTKRILESQNAANETAAAVKGAPGITNVTNNSQSGPQTVNNYGSAPEVVSTAGKGAGNKNITITNSPTIIVEGNKPDDLDAKLAQNNADLLKQVENLLDKKDDDERRSKYD